MPGAASGDHGASCDLAIWLVDLEAATGALATIDERTALLPGAERTTLQQASAAAGPGDRITARRALRLLIEHTFGTQWRAVPFTTTARGRPTIAGLDGTFNLSHGGGKALIVLGTMESAGADIERTRPVHITGERRIALQAAAINAAGGSPLPPDDGARALQAWVRLEALAKADGGGIGSILAAFGIWGTSQSGAHDDHLSTKSRAVQSGGSSASATIEPHGTTAIMMSAEASEAGPQGTQATALAQAGACALLKRFRVHDLSAGEGLHAAVALPRGIDPPALSVFPLSVADLERLRAGAPLQPRI